jgi:hypothetical protein
VRVRGATPVGEEHLGALAPFSQFCNYAVSDTSIAMGTLESWQVEAAGVYIDTELCS